MPKNIPNVVTKIQKYKNKKIDYNTEKSISYSQFSMYLSCPHKWYLTYIKKLAPYQPSIHTVFGTAIHETIQKWITVMYEKSIKASSELDLPSLLVERLKKTYKKEKYNNNHISFSSSEEMQSFYEDGLNILEFLSKKRSDYFTKKYTYFVGEEIPIVQEVRPGVYFKGYIDLVFYDSFFNRFKIIDLKTSTSGWNDYAKKDEAKTAQLILYKEFFARQFNIDVESIEIEFLILKRKIPFDSEFIPKHIQRFTPPSGKIKRGKIMRMFDDFIETVFDENGEYREVEFDKIPSENNCRFCIFKDEKSLCNVGVS